MSARPTGSSAPGVPPVGRLRDGTPYFAPLGDLQQDGELVRCHLCGRWFRSVSAHLRSHGLDRAAYVAMFGLELTGPLEGGLTRKRRAAAMTERHVHDPVIRAATVAAVARARTGELTRAAVSANTGRRHPLQRKQKTLAALDAVRPEVQAEANRRRADAQLLRTAQEAVARRGLPDIRSYVLQGLAAGRSLTALSTAVGLHKDWLARHLDRIVDDATWRERLSRPRDDPRWAGVLARSGEPDVVTYLRRRHVDGHVSVAAIALESGLGRWAVSSAMAQHGIEVEAHTGRRQAARELDRQLQARTGFDSVCDYLTDRRGRDWTWARIAEESGRSPTWLRRRWAENGASVRSLAR